MARFAPVPPEEGADWLADGRRYLGSVLRYKWLVIGLTIFGTAVGMALARAVLPPGYVARATVWIQVPAHLVREESPIWSGPLPISSGWVDLLRTNIVLEHVVRLERLYLGLPVAADSDALATFAVSEKERVRPGAYKLEVDASGKTFKLSERKAGVVDGGVVGDSVGARLGFVWVAPPPALRPGRVIEFAVTSPSDAASVLGKQLKVSSDVDGNFLRLELVGPDPALTTATVNAVAERFVAAAADLKHDKLGQLTGILTAQLEHAQANLREAETALRKFRVGAVTRYSAGATSVTPNMRFPSDPMFAALLDMKATRAELLRDRDAILRILAQPPESGLMVDALGMIGSVQRSTELSQALRDLTTKQAELRALEVRYTPDAPAVRRVAAAVSALEQHAIPMLATGLAGEMERRAAELGQRVDSMAGDLRSVPALAVEETQLQREVTQAEQALTNLQQRYEEARLAEASSIPDVRLVDPAVEPQVPAENWAPVLVLFAFITSVGAGVGGAVLLDRSDHRVHEPGDVTRRMGLKILGVVPHLDRNGRAKPSGTAVIEAMRGIRLNVLHAHGVGPAIVTVTSPGRADGKSFVASNLAVACADAGYRTLLVDADIRCGRLHRALHLARKPGLTDRLAGDVTTEQVVQLSAYGSLSFVGGGTRTHGGPALVSSAALPQFLAELRSSYDAIILDSSPLAAGADAFALGVATGSMLLVLRTGVSDGELAQTKLQLIDHLPIRVLGAVLNDMRAGGKYRNYSYYLEGYETENEPDTATQVLRGPE
ncbi:MAG TPA: hypothetical protein VM716_14325 [Gemmatimonadales bacterium]|nr:hypothetical protein [Gemmatimonadales bacterium]